MIIYQARWENFRADAFHRDIEEVVSKAYFERTGSSVAPSEVRAWKASLLEMARVLLGTDIAEDVQVAIEYRIPQTSKRVDFLVAGRDHADRRNLVIVELKQWSSATATDKDSIILARRGGSGAEREGAHPSYQAWSYAMLLQGFNETIYEGNVGLNPCAYLHNYASDGVIDGPFYARDIERAPLFLKGEQERQRLGRFIRQHAYRPDDTLLYEIEHGRVRPSKMLAEALQGMLKGNEEFVLIDDQKVAFETAMAVIRASTEDGRKRVLLVEGGPGTGKTVLAINLLVASSAERKLVRYVSKNAAPRAVYKDRLAGSRERTMLNGLFSGSGAFIDTKHDTYDALIVDEAHRLNAKSGLYANLGENQIKELIASARASIFFVDDDQRVTLNDIGSVASITSWGEKMGAEVSTLGLESQFRCNGSDGYLAWVDHTLGIRTTANQKLERGSFDFRVMDSPVELHEEIERRNAEANKARVVAGYCWNWRSKRDPKAFDIEIPRFDYRRRWNLTSDGSLWIVAPESIDQVGCIHTCQGLELDYVGVIVGPDLVVRDGRLVSQPDARARTDKSLSGYRAMHKRSREEADRLAGRIIRNTYRTLMTRGMRGCFVYCTDSETGDYFRSRIEPLRYPVP